MKSNQNDASFLQTTARSSWIVEQKANAFRTDGENVFFHEKYDLKCQIFVQFPVPVNYATATIPTYAPFGTEYTPEHSMQIVGGRPIAYPTANVPSRKLL